MENSPFNIAGNSPATESGPKKPESETKDKDKKDSKKSKAIGSIVFERPTAEKPEKTKAPEAESKPTPEAESKDTPELSPEDTQYVVNEIATERRSELADEPLATDPEDQAATEAAQEFYDKIVDEGLDPEMAAAEILAEVGPEEPIENEPDTSEDDDAALPPSTPPSATGGSNGGTPPPRNRTPGMTPPPPGQPSLPPVAVVQVGTMPAPAAPNVYIPYVDRSHAFGDVLVGGIVGYLIGRRRGRIKTERKLLPVQRKLEREVHDLKENLVQKEFTIREAARQRVREQVTRALQPEMVIMDRHKRPNLAPPPERIGKVLIAAETIAIQRFEQPVETPKLDKQVVERQVETLTRNELLTLSEKVIVEGSTLRNVYETNLISERGLRRLVTEYLRGGDVVRAFKRELIEREIDFERDPKLRDTVRKNLRGGGASPTLTKLLQQAGVAPVDDTQADIAEARAQQLAEAKRASKKANNRKMIDISLVTVIAALLAVVIMLAIDKL